MKTNKTNRIFFFVRIILLIVAVAFFFLFDTFFWTKNNQHTELIIGLFAIFFLVIGASFFVSLKRKRNTKINFQWSLKNKELLEEILKEIRDGHVESALKILYEFKSQEVEEEINQLTSQYSKFQESCRLGIISYEEKNLRFNQINNNIIKLVKSIDKSIEKDEREIQTIISHLKARYQNRLNQKLGNRQPVNLRQIPSTIGTSKETSSIFVSIAPENIKAEIDKVFKESYGRLLIVGKPGVGKSCLLLQLALKLLEPQQPSFIPLILELAYWQVDYFSIDQWLEKLIPKELGVNQSYARKIIKNYNLIILFDGFDEAGRNSDFTDEKVNRERLSFLNALGKFGANPKNKFVITSRIKEYQLIPKDAPINLQIEIGSLNFDHIEKELEKIAYDQPEAKPLLYALTNNNQLKEIVKTPFYFNLLQLLFANGLRFSDLRLSNSSIEEMKDEIIDRYISFQLGSDNNHNTKIIEIRKRWLSFISHQIYYGTNFELKHINYNYLDFSKTDRFWGGFLDSIVLGLPLVLLILVYDIFFWKWPYIPHVTIGFLILSAIKHGIYSSRTDNYISIISTKDKLKFSWKKLRRNFKWPFLITTTALFSFLLVKIDDLNFSLTFFSLLFSIVIGAIATLIFFPFILIPEYSNFIQISHPYQRFYASIYNFHFSILQHWLIRYQAYRNGLLPLKLVNFLNEMAKLHIFETDRATWRFRHQLLHLYFYRIWAKQNEEDEFRKKKIAEFRKKYIVYAEEFEALQKKELDNKKPSIKKKIENILSRFLD